MMRENFHLAARRISSAISLLCLAALLQACASRDPKELTRPRALDVLSAHKEFNTPVTLSLVDESKFPVRAEAEDEPEPTARALEAFFAEKTTMAVLHHLGLVEATATAVERPEVFAFTGRLSAWKFAIETRLTAKGKTTAQAAGLKGERAVALYRKEIVEVTGIRKESENKAVIEFTWKSIPTSVGEAFDPSRAAFQSLPAELRERISKPTIFGNSGKLTFDRVSKGTAYVALYDDGWRVDYLQ